MSKLRMKCKKIGKGTADDPYQPDIFNLPEFKQFLQAIDKARKENVELNNITFFTVHIIKEDKDGFEVEIEFPDDEYIENNCPRPVVIAWQKLKDSLAEKYGT